MKRRSFTAALGVAACAPFVARAQGNYPERAVTIINPFPGGPTDTYARLVARKLQEKWGQPVVVDGRAGAGGMIAVNAVAKAKPDGYTLLVASASNMIVQPVVRKSTPYDVERDLIPIVSTGQTSQLVVVHPSVPAKNLGDLIAYARANPGKLTYGSSGLGTALHLAGEVFAVEAGVKLMHVPYKTAAQSVTDLLGGQVDMMFDSVANSGPHIKNGKLRGLAVMGPVRAKELPDVKTTTELGLPGAGFQNWLGVYAPAGTPKAVVDRILEILRPIATDADFNAFYDSAGMTYTPLFGTDLAQASIVERRNLAAVVSKAGIPPIE